MSRHISFANLLKIYIFIKKGSNISLLFENLKVNKD